MKLCEDSRCFGCCACMNVCPKGAITMKENAHGVLLPEIDDSLCINCGLCAKVCPSLRLPQMQTPAQCLAAWSTNTDLRKTAASAGIISALSERVVQNGGVVFGTRFEQGKLIFDHTETVSGLLAFQGSKYVHAAVGDAYQKVKVYLSQGRQVLFPGTPCQIAGLKQFLRRDDDNLLTVDLMCHGVTTGKYLNEYAHQKLNVKEFSNILFRGEFGQAFVVYQNGKPVHHRLKLLSPFYMAYVKGLLHRENCYQCPFASTERCSDLTAGDFWGLDRSALKGDVTDIPFPSLVLVNTPKGQKFLSESAVYAEERPLSEAVAGNVQLTRPCVRHPDRDLFLQHYQSVGFYAALRKTPFHRRTQRQAAKYRVQLFLHKIKHAIIK